ncbi:MAG TPA: LPXTG cell wall anchor domain-containing protein, partial [Nitrospira sp.]
LERPVLTDVRIEGLHKTDEMFPSRIPDLYDGEPVVVALKSGKASERVTIRGSIGRTSWSTTISLNDTEAREGLSVYWARQKIASLLDGQPYGQDDSPVRQAVLDVALAYHLVSKYTSLVAVDTEPVRPTDKTLVTHAMKTNLPDGQDYQAIFGLPKTATSGQMQLLFGLAMLAIAFLVWGHRKVVA